MKPLPMVRVMNCRKGSYAWFHEQRHSEQEKRYGLLSKWSVVDNVLKALAVVLCVFQQWFLVSTVVVALFALDFALEFDAELYALKKTGNWKAWLRIGDAN